MAKKTIQTKWLLLGVLTVMLFFKVSLYAQTEKGIELFNAYEFSKAEQVLRDNLKSDPGNIEAGYYLGLSLYMQKKYEDALNVFKGIKEDRKSVV